MNININEVLDYLKSENIYHKYEGEVNLSIGGFCSLNKLKDNCITWIKDINRIKEQNFIGYKSLLIVANETGNENNGIENKNFIYCNNPKEVFFSILNQFFKQQEYKEFISPKSIVETKDIGENVYIGHNCFIDNNVSIGSNVVIENNVSIEGRVIVGNNTIIHSGSVIGTDGFGYFQNEEGLNIKVPHYGGVIIGNSVEIGANTCIDRGTLDDTEIGDNVKIDNLCHIAHNVIIKNNCSVIALSMLAGSVVLGNNAYIAPGAMIMNQLKIGENSLVGLGAVVVKDVKDNVVVAGVPAKTIRENI